MELACLSVRVILRLLLLYAILNLILNIFYVDS